MRWVFLLRRAETRIPIRDAYIGTGKVKYVFREMLTGNPNLAAAGFLTARCAGPAKYFQVVDEIYKRQMEIYQSGAVLRQVAFDAGLSNEAYTACLSDQAALAALQGGDRRAAARKIVRGVAPAGGVPAPRVRPFPIR